jgi:hypothetical protein
LQSGVVRVELGVVVGVNIVVVVILVMIAIVVVVVVIIVVVKAQCGGAAAVLAGHGLSDGHGRRGQGHLCRRPQSVGMIGVVGVIGIA